MFHDGTSSARPLKAYLFVKFVCNGRFGKVTQRFYINSLTMEAVKNVKTTGLNREELAEVTNENDTMSRFQQRNIVKYFENKNWPTNTYVVMEYPG